jgi:hypothetical protein
MHMKKMFSCVFLSLKCTLMFEGIKEGGTQVQRLHNMTKSAILRDMDKLVHTKHDGFYDRDLDMYFEDLGEWLVLKHNTTWSQLI